MRVYEERDPQSWVLKALRETGHSLLVEFEGLSDTQMRWRPGEGELSLKETVAHLRDAEALAFEQITAFVESSSGSLPAWDIEVLPLERDYQSGSVTRTLTELRDLRRRTTHLLWMVSDSEWDESKEHPYRGRVTLGQIARELAQHDLEHLWEVRRRKDAVEPGEPRKPRHRDQRPHA